MKKVMFLLLLVLITLFLFAGSGTQDLPKQSSISPVSAQDFPERERDPINDKYFVLSDDHAKKENVLNDKEEPAPKVNCRLALFPKENDAELHLQSLLDKDQILGTEIQIFNSNGERVYVSKFQSEGEKIDLGSFKSGKYTVKVGDQSYSVMII